MKRLMKTFYKVLKEHAVKITSFEILKMLPLIEKENKSNYKLELCYLCKNKLYRDIKIYWKV